MVPVFALAGLLFGILKERAARFVSGFSTLPKEEQEMYVRAAEKILRTIAEKRADFGKNCDAIVQNCTASYGSPQTHITMVYADYFFVEALYKLEAQRTGKELHLMW